MSVAVATSWSEPALLQLQQQQNGLPASLLSYRQQQLADFKQQGWPLRRSEQWKYTLLQTIAKQEFGLPTTEASYLAPQVTDQQIEIFIVDGKLCLDSSTDILPPGLKIVPLVDFIKDAPEDYLASMQQIDSDGLAYVKLNQAVSLQGLVVKLAPNVVINKTLRLTYISSQALDDTMQHWQQLVFVGENAELELVSNIKSNDTYSSLLTFLKYFQLQKNSRCHYFSSDRLNARTSLLSSMQVFSHKNAEFNHFLLSGRGQLSRFDDTINLIQEKASATLYQLCHAKDQQQIDSQLTIRHLAASTVSTPVLRGIADDRASVTFNGSIYVAANAPGSEARLQNKNLLLSSQAVINTKPDLEIYTDDVTCSHGATIGELDREALFYLRSRGLNEKAARAILLQGFFSDIIEDFPVIHWRSMINACLMDLMVEENNE